MATKARSEDWDEPVRDERGRFIKAKSGNYDGRPRKPPERPWNLSETIADALDEEVRVTEGGVTRSLKLRDYIAKNVVRGLTKAKPREVMNILDRLASLGALDPRVQPAEEWPDGMSELLDSLKQKYRFDFCERCMQQCNDEGSDESGGD